eukprot:TRINITY_DN1554_c0_g1_i4.p1 TRINITY_DN1554_c0_g1~~TRINITY_DN1554_c0_g1_i4.p1  ORF type:complete len:250 (-),score=18.76 TRINITY_DN1554_c0_g1_i4:1697-2446(-)
MASKPSAPLASISPPPSITYFAWRSLDYCLRERKLQLDAAAYTVEEINAAVTGHEPEDDRLSVAIPEAWQAYKSQESGSAIAAAAAENDVLTREEAAEFTRWLAYAASKAVNDHEDPASRRPAQPSDEAFTVKLPGTQVSLSMAMPERYKCTFYHLAAYAYQNATLHFFLPQRCSALCCWHLHVCVAVEALAYTHQQLNEMTSAQHIMIITLQVCGPKGKDVATVSPSHSIFLCMRDIFVGAVIALRCW